MQISLNAFCFLYFYQSNIVIAMKSDDIFCTLSKSLLDKRLHDDYRTKADG